MKKLVGSTLAIGLISALAPAGAGVIDAAARSSSNAAVLYKVNTTKDGNLSNPTSTQCIGAVESPKKCTLRAAIQAAANQPQNTTVTIDVPSGVYKLTVPDDSTMALSLHVNNPAPLHIVGAGSGTTTVDAGFQDRAFFIESGGGVTITGMTVTNGRPDDLGQVSSCPGSAPSSAPAENGGGILQQSGGLTLVGDVITGNITTGYGGGIDNEGSGALILNGTAVTHNISCGNSSHAHGGGGIDTFDGGALTIRRSTIAQNTAAQQGSGGGILEPESGSNTKIYDSTISGNKAQDGNGGGIAAESGGTYLLFGDLFTGNSATGNADSQSGYGGGFDNSVNSTDSFVNTTFTGNSAETDGGAIEAGEGFYAPAETVSFSTLDGNSSTNGAGNIGTAGSETGGASLDNSVIIRGQGGNCSGPLGFVDNGNNLFDTGAAQCGSTPADHDVITGAPKLGSLADNGGPTKTEALLAGSPAIDAANTSRCTSETKNSAGNKVDQREVVPRPEGARCDIGAFEATPNLGISASPSLNSIFVGQQDTVTDVIGNSGPPGAMDSTFTDPAAGSLIDSVTTSQGTCTHTQDTASCQLGTVPTGGKVTIKILLTGLTPGMIDLLSSTATSGDDLDLANNHAAVGIHVKATPKPPPPGPPAGKPSIVLARISPACFSGRSRIKLDAKARAGSGIRSVTIKLAGKTILTFHPQVAMKRRTVRDSVRAAKLKSGRSYPVSATLVDVLGRKAHDHSSFMVCRPAPPKRPRGFTG